MTSIQKALIDATNLLSDISPSARIDAEILLSMALKVNKTFLYTYPENELNAETSAIYQSLLKTRAKGTPIAYITGTREFWSLNLHVSNATLIPRPETELLIEKALAMIDASHPARLLDLGTGSGAIALALAHSRPNWQIVACDKSEQALEIAVKNAKQLAISNVTFVCSNWFTHITATGFDAIVSNPPYIAEQDPHLSVGDLQFEPKDALVSGMNGLESLHYIIKHSYNRLLPNGLLLLEHGYNQRQAVDRMLHEHGYQNIECWQDWQGHDRISSARRR
ncbi:MAG: peptide chain release factor N(5)-glutamine methyltransferase [Legionellaceae bacterium]|nr:peptide chain release factor N(5)-glutamine methyltransferase [Legionellaceae bacterium]